MNLQPSTRQGFKFEVGHGANCTCAFIDGASRRDPTGTTTIRNRFESEAGRRFRRLKGLINTAVVQNDVFGLKRRTVGDSAIVKDAAAPQPGAFAFARSAGKVNLFMEWLHDAQNEVVLGVAPGVPMARAAEDAWSNVYIESAYQKGLKDSASKLRAAGATVEPSWINNAFHRPIHADRVGLAYTRVFNELEGITDVMDQQISRVLAQGISQGKGPMEIARDINNRVDKIGITRARTLARTECLTGDMIVDGADIESAHKRWYDGDIIKIQTADGRYVSVTPNHPMLTQRGWVLAGEISDSDYLICDDRIDVPRFSGDEDVNNTPSSISKVFGSVAAVGVIERKTTRKPDFHGDGMEGYVDIASPNRELSIGDFAPVLKHSFDFSLSESYGSRTMFCGFSGSLLPVDERVSLVLGSLADSGFFQSIIYSIFANAVMRGELPDALSGLISIGDLLSREPIEVSGHNAATLIEHLSSLGVGSENPLFAELLLNPPNGVFEAFADLIARGSIFVHADHGIIISSGVGFFLVGGSGSFASIASDSGVPESLAHSSGTDAEMLGSLRDRKPASVKADRVVKVDRSGFSGHVYNLSTCDGYFTIQGGIFTGNTISAHAEASLNAYEEAGIQGVEVEAEFTTAGDGLVCELCQAYAGTTRPISESRGLIPLHPNCRCAFLPLVINGTGIILS
jgi:hypothetical protein